MPPAVDTLLIYCILFIFYPVFFVVLFMWKPAKGDKTVGNVFFFVGSRECKESIDITIVVIGHVKVF